MRRLENTPGQLVGRRLLLAALLVCAGVAAYLPALRAGFVWDDDTFLTANALIKAPDGLSRFWFTTQASDYWPVTSTTLWIEWRLWGAQAAGYHCVNLALHLGEALLLWAILRRLAVPGAYLAALLFVVHPVNVESVAWIAQRKNLLAMLFFLASIWCYLNSSSAAPTPVRRSSKSEGESPGAAPPVLFWYALSLLAFALGLLSKGSVAPLPLVLLLITAWQGRSSWREVVRLLPFFLLSGVLVAVDVWFQKHGAGSPIRSAGPVTRLLGAGAVVWFYLFKAVWPVHLAFVYPYWKIDPGDLLWWIPSGAALALTTVLWRCRHSARVRPALFAWAFFAIMLIPVMGFTDVYFMKYSLVADHYQHLALLGLVAAAGGAWARWERKTGEIWPRLAAAGVVAVLGLLTFIQCRDYRDLETLYRSTAEKNPGSWLVQNNLGVLLLDQGQTDAAMARFRAALRLKPDYAEAHIDLGKAFLRLNQATEAVREFQAALAEKSDFDREAHLDLGHAWFQLGKPGAAADEYRAALRIDPAYAEAHYSLGNVLFSLDRFDAAVTEYRAALRTAPDDAEALNNLGGALVRAGHPQEAVAEYEKALGIRPQDPSIQANLRKAQSDAAPPGGQR